ncbi:hypothetical protein [Streptomyces sp. NPDC058240]|uniref:hypothetical protein n=1 Tax=Streptomyces sp. NPDC058240 TaxID=3346396 RepID=UPI0036E033D5
MDAGHKVMPPRLFTATEPITGALDDMTAVRGVPQLFADISGPEIPPGTALLIGAALAFGARRSISARPIPEARTKPPCPMVKEC